MMMYCNACRKSFKENDMVYLDELNTVIHQACYSSYKKLPVKDSGEFIHIINKYHFFRKHKKMKLILDLESQIISNMQDYSKLHNVSVNDLITALFIEHAQDPMEVIGMIQKEQGNLDELDDFGKMLNHYLDDAANNEEDEALAEVFKQLRKVHISKLEVLTDLYNVYKENKKPLV